MHVSKWAAKSRKQSHETRRTAPFGVSLNMKITITKGNRQSCSTEHCTWSLLVSVVHPSRHFPAVASFLPAIALTGRTSSVLVVLIGIGLCLLVLSVTSKSDTPWYMLSGNQSVKWIRKNVMARMHAGLKLRQSDRERHN